MAERVPVLRADEIDEAASAAAIVRPVIGHRVVVPDRISELGIDAVHRSAIAIDQLRDGLAVRQGLQSLGFRHASCSRDGGSFYVDQDDIEAIKQLKARYFRLMNAKDWDAMRRVFTDDLVMDTTSSGGGVMTGADPFMQFLRNAIGDVLTVHHGHTPEIELTSATTATGVWAMEDVLRAGRRHGAARLRPLSRQLREGRRPLVYQGVDADPPADGHDPRPAPG